MGANDKVAATFHPDNGMAMIPDLLAQAEASRQPRERAVPCRECHKSTWNVDARCNECRHCEVCDRPWPQGYNHCPSDKQPWHVEREERMACCPDCNEAPCHPQCVSGGGL